MRFKSKLHARQNPTLHHSAAPLATGVAKISSVDKNNKKIAAITTFLVRSKTNFSSIIRYEMLF